MLGDGWRYMPMKLSAADRRLYKAMTSVPWDASGGPSFSDAVENPAFYDPTKYGIARRVVNNDPTEIVRFGCLGIRHCWRYYLNNPAAELRCLWNVGILALSINDFEGMERIKAEVAEVV